MGDAGRNNGRMMQEISKQLYFSEFCDGDGCIVLFTYLFPLYSSF
jgi:hypothetical protein